MLRTKGRAVRARRRRRRRRSAAASSVVVGVVLSSLSFSSLSLSLSSSSSFVVVFVVFVAHRPTDKKTENSRAPTVASCAQVVKLASDREIRFYERVADWTPELLDFVPKYHGVLGLRGADDLRKYVREKLLAQKEMCNLSPWTQQLILSKEISVWAEARARARARAPRRSLVDTFFFRRSVGSGGSVGCA
jgi:hypothetical protein